MTPTGIRAAGDRALLIECESLDAVLALNARLLDTPLPGQRDCVPAARTVLLCFDTARQAAAARGPLATLEASPIDHTPGREITIDVVYDGADLADVARHTGLSAKGIIAAHTGQRWRAAFGGFAPGFFYMIGEDERLAVPRRETPRTRVPAGAVGLAGAFSAVYPKASPGGWQLIGRTDAKLWDLARDEPALLRAGDIIRYRAVEYLAEDDAPVPSAEPECEPGKPRAAMTVTNPGLQSLFQDLGRTGHAHLGVPAAGAADESSARQANRLVGNPAKAAVIETLLDGIAVTADGNTVLAITGAPGQATIDGRHGPRPAPMRQPFALLDGERLTLGPLMFGLRRYIAVRGGFALDAILGSRARDTLSEIGPPPLASGQRLDIEPAPAYQIVGAAEPATVRVADDDGIVRLRVLMGPRDDWFDSASLDRLTEQIWQVTDQSNRIGVRLALADAITDDASPCVRAVDAELPSEGCVPGALQVPPAGLPVLFLKDHPVTGGYPVIAVVVTADLDRAAQLAPGDAVKFVVDTAAKPAKRTARS